MAIVLIAVLVAIVAGHVVPDLARLRDYSWFASWLRTAAERTGASRVWQGGAGIFISVGVPAALVALLQWFVTDSLYGLAELALGAVVLFYCLGPRDLDLDVAAIVGAPDADRRNAALQALPVEPPDPPLTLTGTVLVDQVFKAALVRWFGVLFWFIVLGPFGAVLYRLTQLARTNAFGAALPPEHRAALDQLQRVLDWPAAHLMTLALAVAADFDAVASAWRDFHAARGRWFVADIGFLLAAGRASVEIEEELDEHYDVGGRNALAELQQAMALSWRILVVWLVVFSLLVLAGSIR
jgi:AmpE protein